MRQAGEPSVEEILDSIKKVIARDTRAVTEPQTPRGPIPAIRDEEDDDILDLGTAAELVDEPTSTDDALLPRETVSSISESLAALAGIGWLCTGLAYVVFFRIVAVAGVANVMLVTFLAPVSAMILGALVLGEGVGANAIAGMVLIFAGLAAIDGRLLSRGKAPA